MPQPTNPTRSGEAALGILDRDTGRRQCRDRRALVRRFLSAPGRVASPKLLDFFDPQVELYQSASVLGTEGTFHGDEGLGRAARVVFAAFRGAHWVPQRLEAVGDDVVAVV
jgi:hypothetical protein